MPVDKGGLRYTIEAREQFVQTFDTFRSEVQGARSDLIALQRTARRGVEVKKLRDGLRGARGESKQLADDLVQIGRETGLTGKALKEEVVARRKLASEQSKIRVETKKARAEADEQFETAKKTLGVTRQQAKAQREVTREIDKLAVAQQKARVASERSSELTEQQRRKLQAVTDVQKDRVRETERLERIERRRSDLQLRSLRLEAAAQERINRAAERRDLESLLASRGLNISGQPIERTNRLAVAMERLDRILGPTNNKANRVSFTFRRLFGILAAFTIVREVARGFALLVRNAVTLNAEIEQAQLGIASLFLAVGQVRDPFGRTVSNAEGLVLAQKEARRQTQLLRQDALRTNATFRSLLDTFQVAIAPGLTAGLDIDQVRRFTVQISQAASAIGLQQNQLAEEIRSILQGTIQIRTTRIAASLGITNEDIRNAREAGVLAEFLEQRFVAFNEAGKASLNTFNGLISRIQDGFEILITTGAVEFFEEVKDAARDVFDALTDFDTVTGAITPDPRAVQVIAAVAGGLQRAVAAARGIRENLRFEDVLRVAQGVGTAISTAAQIALGLLEGVVLGVSDVQAALDVVLDAVRKIFGVADADSIRDTARVVTRIATILVAIQLTTSVLNGLLGLAGTLLSLMIAPLTIITGLSATIQVLWSPVTLIILGVVAALVLAVAQFVLMVEWSRRLLSQLTGVDIKLVTLVKLMKTQLLFYLKLAVLEIKKFGSYFTSTSGLVKGVIRLGTLITDFILSPIEVAAGVLARLGLISDQQAQKIRTFNNSIADRLEAQLTSNKDTTAEIEKQISLLRQRNTLELQGIINNNDNEKSVTEALSGLVDGAGNFLQEKLFGDLFDPSTGQIAQGTDQASGLVAEFDKLQPSAGRAVTTLQSLSDIAKRLKDDIESSSDALALTEATLGLDGNASALVRTAFDAQVRLRKEGKQIDDEILQVQRDIARAAQSRASVEGTILTLREEEKTTLDIVSDRFTRLANVQREIFRIEKDRTIARAQLARATEQGLAQGIEEARAALEGIEQEFNAVKAAETGIKEELSALSDLAEQFGVSTEKLGRLARERIELAGDETALSENLNLLLRERSKLESQISTVLANRQADAAIAASLEQQRDNQQALFDLERARLDARLRLATEEDKALSRAELSVSQATRQLQISAQEAQRNLDALNSQREQLSLREQQFLLASQQAQSDEESRIAQAGIQATKAAGVALDRLILQTQRATNIELEQGRLKLEQQRFELERIRAGLERPLATGLIEGLRQFVEDAGLLFQNLANITTDALQSVGQEGASIIADLFDPNKNVNLRQRIGQFLLGLGQQILQTLINTLLAQLVAIFLADRLFQTQKEASNLIAATAWASVGVQWAAIANTLLIAAALLAGSGGGFGFAAGGPIGRAEGGPMPRGVSAPKAPKGLHPTDRIPIWAAKDEFMIRAKSALGYGHDVMDAINRGMIDPMALRALAGVSRVRRHISKVAKTGLASGGPVVSSPIQSAQVDASSTGDSTPIPAYIVPSDQAVEFLLNAGKNAAVRFMDEQGYQRG